MFEIEIINDREKEMVDASAERCFIDENKTLWFPIFVPNKPTEKYKKKQGGQWQWALMMDAGCDLMPQNLLDVSNMEEVRLTVQVTIGRDFDRKAKN